MPPKRKVKRKSPDDPDSDEEAAPPSKKQDTKKTPIKVVPKPVEPKVVELKIVNDYPNHYRKTCHDYGAKIQVFNQVVDEENHFRELFAQKRDSTILNNPHLMLVDVHGNKDIFVTTEETPEEARMPKVFPLGDKKKEAGKPCIVNETEFQRNFDLFTEFQLRYLNWENVFVAGGSALACLQPIREPHGKDNISRRYFFHNLAYKSSDIDLFIHGIDDPQKAAEKVDEIYESVIQSIPVKAIAFRSTHAITIVSEFPYRHIQIVLRLYKSPAEILMGFDVDSCSVGYDGKRVWMTPRAHRALTHQYNAVDMTRRSPSYEMRLAKYAERGFAVLVPSLDRNRIDPQLFERRFDQLQGLAKLILLERLNTPEARTKFKEQQRMRKLRPPGPLRQTFWDQLNPFGHDEWNDERLRETGGADASDYSTVFLPWGPKWNAKRCRKMMYTKDMILNSKWYDPQKKHHTHPCFFGTVKEIFKDCCGSCPPVPEDEREVHDSMYVAGKAEWVTVNPGQQTTARIGSFHPITEGDWTEGAYVAKEAEKLFVAINEDDVKTVEECLNSGIELMSKDSMGRSPLHVAALCNAVKVTKVLLGNGVRVSSKTNDGRTALHIAAQYGNTNIVQLILERAKEIQMDLEENPKPKKGKGNKGKEKKKPKGDDEDEEMDDEEEEGDDDGDGDDEGDGDEGDGDGDGDDGEFESIKVQIEKRKKAQQEAEEALDPSLKADEGDDILDINDTDWDMKMTPLHYAIFFGWTDCVKTLLDGGVDKEKDLVYLNDAGQKVKIYTLLHLCVVNDQVDVAKLLLKEHILINKLDLSYENVLHKAAALLHLDFITMFVEWKEDDPKNKVDINSFNQSLKTPLHIAMEASHKKRPDAKEIDWKLSDPCFDEKFEVIEYLVSEGAKVEFKIEDLPSKSSQHHIEYHIRNEGASKLSQLRASIQQPLILAIEMGSPRLVKYFISKKVNVNWISMCNQTTTGWDMVVEWIKDKKEEKETMLRDQEAKKKILPKNPKSFLYYQLYVHLQIWRPILHRRTKRIKFKKFKNRDSDSENSSDSEIEIVDEEDPEKKEKSKKRKLQILEFNLEQRMEIQSILKAAGAKSFSQIKLTSQDDEDLKEDQKNFKAKKAKGKKTLKSDSPKLDFSSIPEFIPGAYLHTTVYDKEDQDLYKKLHQAVFLGNLSLINDLTIKQPIGKQAHIVSQSSLTGLSTLQLAIIKNSPEMVRRIIEVAIAQYTPLTPPDKAEVGKTISLNNYDLARLINTIKPGQFLDKSGMSSFQVYDERDPNKETLQLNCICSPATLITHSGGGNWNVCHYVAYYGSNEAFKALIELINKENIKPAKFPTTGRGRHVQKSLLENLFESQNNIMLTPFELAIVRGNFDTAALFLRLGCLKKRGQAPSKATKEEDDEEEEGQYKGLDVGGKKMDWAKDHHAKNEEDHERYAIHVAASFNQWKAIDFLLFSAEKEWSVGKSSDEEVKHFRLDTVEKKSGNTVYHYAISRNNNDVLKKLLSADKQSVFNQPEINGVTPLHLAALYGNVEAVKLLIENRADIEAKVKKNGWTPLFYAVYANQSECVSTLLSAKAQIDTALTPNYKQTPLMLAAFYGRHESIQLMLETKCDIYIQDTCGETALHHAVKRGHYSAVKLLLNKKVPQYMEENGLGLTPLDGAMLKLIGEFPSHRSSRGDNDITLSHHQQLIYNHLIRIESKDRILAKPDQVVKVTFMMMDNAKAEVEAEKAAKLKQKHTHYFERREKEIKPPDDMHIISMTMPRAEFSNIQLPDLPPINTDGDVNMDDEDEKSEEEKPTSLKGMTFAISGTFSKKRNTLISLIKKNGGNYASTITKAVTHVLVADLDDKSAKITQAKADGKKIVGESFLENLDENDSESEVSE